MNYSPPQHLDDNAEISLVDLAVILVKRWKFFAVIFLIILLSALIYILVVPRTYSYTSLYNVAEQGPDKAMEAPETLVAKAQNLYLGPETRKLLASMNSNMKVLPFETAIKNPEQTLLVSLTSEASKNDASLVDQLHSDILLNLKKGQEVRLENQKQSLQRQLEDTQNTLDVAKNSDSLNAAEIMASLMERIATLKNNLAELREGEISQTAVQSLETTGISSILIISLSIVFGAILAVIGTFFVHFITLVRSRL